MQGTWHDISIYKQIDLVTGETYLVINQVCVCVCMHVPACIGKCAWNSMHWASSTCLPCGNCAHVSTHTTGRCDRARRDRGWHGAGMCGHNTMHLACMHVPCTTVRCFTCMKHANVVTSQTLLTHIIVLQISEASLALLEMMFPRHGECKGARTCRHAYMYAFSDKACFRDCLHSAFARIQVPLHPTYTHSVFDCGCLQLLST